MVKEYFTVGEAVRIAGDARTSNTTAMQDKPSSSAVWKNAIKTRHGASASKTVASQDKPPKGGGFGDLGKFPASSNTPMENSDNFSIGGITGLEARLGAPRNGLGGEGSGFGISQQAESRNREYRGIPYAPESMTPSPGVSESQNTASTVTEKVKIFESMISESSRKAAMNPVIRKVYKHADITAVPTTGASEKSSKGIGYSGVPASRHMAKRDLERMDNFKEIIVAVRNETGVDSALIAGRAGTS